MKVDIEQIRTTLEDNKVEPSKVASIIKELEQAVEEEKADRQTNADPKLKWEYFVIVNDPEKKITGDFTAWVVQQKEGQDAGLMLSKLVDAAKTQNEGAKRKKHVITGFAELFHDLKGKWIKEKGLRIKTKEPVRVFTVNGKNLL